MSRKFIERTGEENYNNFGSKMIITRYKTNKDIDVYFPEYNWTAKGVRYGNFKRGTMSCLYEPTTYGIGYIGEGKYKIHDENGKMTKCYSTWHSMLQRCYDEKYHENHPTYKGCKVYDELLCFQNFGEWFEDNYYEIENERMCLDKDILHKGNKIYSSENCVFVPHNINTLFIKNDKYRGEYPIGVSYYKASGKFEAKCSVYDYKGRKAKSKNLGSYNTLEEAFNVYKIFKENYIKQVADCYKDRIPKKLYDAMYDYKVEIND